MANQLSGDRPRALERRKAIYELILLFAFKMRLKVEGHTPSLKASCLPVISKGTRYTSLINSPGWGGLCMGISGSPRNLK